MKCQNGEAGNDWYCAAVKDNNGSIILSAICTPPYNILIYETGNKHDSAAVDLLACELFNVGYNPPGVLSEQTTANAFAESYAKLIDKKTRIHVTLNLMQLFEVTKIDFASGFMREAVEDDIYFLPYWHKEFCIECGIDLWKTLNDMLDAFKHRLGKNMQYLWIDNGVPVSAAAFNRESFDGAVVGGVYTPPIYRGKGYCTALMAQLSQNLLDRGYKYCCLFADADYPLSNKVYQKVGYKDICLYRDIRFEE